MVSIGIIRTEAFNQLQNMPPVFEGQWLDIERGGIAFRKITAFQHYFTDEVIAQMETVFNQVQQFNDWLALDMMFIDRSWKKEFNDYKQARSRLKQMVQELGGFDALNETEAKVAASWFALTNQQIKITIPELDERLKAGIIFDQESTKSRTSRFNAVKTLLYNVLNQEDSVKVIGSILQFNFEVLYTKLGQEGTSSINYKGEADTAGIYDFIQSTPEGIAAFGYGLKELNLEPLEGFDVDSLIVRIMDILENGNY